MTVSVEAQMFEVYRGGDEPVELESVLLGRWMDTRWLDEDRKVGSVRSEAAVVPSVSSMDEQISVSDAIPFDPSFCQGSLRKYVRALAAATTVMIDVYTTVRVILRESPKLRTQSRGSGSRAIAMVVSKSSMLFTKWRSLHRASGSLVELQSTEIGPANRSAEPNQNTVKTVVKPANISKNLVSCRTSNVQTYTRRVCRCQLRTLRLNTLSATESLTNPIPSVWKRVTTHKSSIVV